MHLMRFIPSDVRQPRIHTPRIHRAAAAILTLVSALAAASSAFAQATYVVSSLNDNVSNKGAGDVGTLRNAINYANAQPGSAIEFASGLKGTITLIDPLPMITSSVTIVGPGASSLAIDGGGMFCPFTIHTSGSVKISGLTLQNGFGGLYDAANYLELDDCSLINNHSYGDGGAIWAGSNTLTLNNCTISGNTGSRGGGIFVYGGWLNISSSTISNNQATSGESGGAGIYIGEYGDVAISHCSISNNRGAGITSTSWDLAVDDCFVQDNSGPGIITTEYYLPASGTRLINDVLTGNSSTGSGGGVEVTVSGVSGGQTYYTPLSIVNCTIVDNKAALLGGGIDCSNTITGATTLTNSIIYGNTSTSNHSTDQMNAPVGSITATYSDIEGGFSGTRNINANPRFVKPPATPGAPMDLHLIPGSPCRGNGTTSGAPTTTIDGFLRTPPPSMGAYGIEPTITLTASSNPLPATHSVTFTATVKAAPLTASGTVKFTVDGKSASTVTLTAGTNPEATFTTSSLTVGIHTIVASYSGTSHMVGSSASLTQTITPLPVVTSISPSAGPLVGGTAVTIKGTGFTPTSSVTFGKNPATNIKVTGSTSLTCIAPVGTGVADVTVASGGGTSLTRVADRYTYDAVPTLTAISPNAGPIAGGTSVTITGKNFLAGAVVNFGSVAAKSVVVTSPTTITCKSPAGSAGMVNVTVTTPGGKSAVVGADRFTYEAVPTISRVSPNSGPASGGTVVTISGTGFVAGAATVKFGGAAATGITVLSATSIRCTLPAGVGTVDISITTPGGMTWITPSDKFTYNKE